jgi:Na+-transporting NADH:ubiquinone oxidoreductase subunit F
MEYIIGIAVFTLLILFLITILIVVEKKLIAYDDCNIIINDGKEDTLRVAGGTTLLNAFVDNGVLLPAACGGGGTCAMCKVCITEGGGDLLPTEEPHLSISEQKENIRLACQVKVKEDMKVQLDEEIFGISKFECEVVSNHNVSTYIKELKFKLPEGLDIEFRAGGYIQVDIPSYDISFKNFVIEEQYTKEWDQYNMWDISHKNEEEIVRAYSMANYPLEKGTVLLNIRIATAPPGMDVPPGIGSTFLFNLQPGDKVILSGPYGEFFAKETKREMCFIGGGAGMAPMRSHILDQLLRIHTDRTITYWYGARSAKEMFYHEEFLQLAKDNPNFKYHVGLSDPQPEDNWDGYVGYIHNVVYDNWLKNHEDPDEIEFYMCGPPMMNSSCLQMLEDAGIERDMIDLDEF